jgi:hypothetical protein
MSKSVQDALSKEVARWKPAFVPLWGKKALQPTHPFSTRSYAKDHAPTVCPLHSMILVLRREYSRTGQSEHCTLLFRVHFFLFIVRAFLLGARSRQVNAGQNGLPNS